MSSDAPLQPGANGPHAAATLLGSNAVTVNLSDTLMATTPPVKLSDGLASGPPTARGAGSAAVLPNLEVDGDGLQLTPGRGPRYAPVRSLGRGGMGEVDLVEDRDIGRSVAVKRLLPEASGPAQLARFVDEVRVTGRLEHPNIVPIHDVGLDDSGRYYFVMKYVPGETLESIISRLAQGDPAAVAHYDITRRVEIFQGLLRALDYAHTAGILHRDLKPANVMVGEFGEVVLMDWGVACSLGRDAAPADATAAPRATAQARLSSTQAGALVGTPHYMSPEQTKGAQFALDVRSDLYSATVLFHELLGLRHRHADQTSLMSVLMAVSTTEPPEPQQIFAAHPSQPWGVPAEYTHYVRRGLALDPKDRWQSARQMIDELHAIQAGHCDVQCPITLMKRMTYGLVHLIDRYPAAVMMAMMLATAGLLVLVGFGVYLLVT